MKYTPDSICRLLAGAVDITECTWMTKCANGMSGAIGSVWMLKQARWIELDQIDWPIDITREPFKKRIRWGSMGKSEIHIHVHTTQLHGIYRYDGETLHEVMVKPGAEPKG